MRLNAWFPLLFVAAGFTPPRKEFHQGVAYRIEAQLDDATNVLTGRASLRYTNRSPDALDTLFFHLHLNAFRPNSGWAQRELQTNNRRFQDLGPDDFAYDRVSRITVNGRVVKPVFPFAPDSTVMAVPLPARIAPKAIAIVNMDWTSRLATVARRQGRKGRHYDWAHWYPRIAVYDTAGWETQQLLPQGEFFGEFASYDVTLDVADDQVIGATGVPVTGDPGWEHANRTKDKPPLTKHDAYAPRVAQPLGLLAKIDAGRKRIRWRAENVHHFAWAADPAFVYEGDRLGDVALHALFLPTDTLWPGAVINEMKRSLQFYDTVLGPYVYPQLTALHRVDGGGTEFPMMTMNGTSPPINHETGHEWAHAMLANNEFKSGWLDEGFVSFLGFMYAESHGNKPNYGRTVAGIAHLDSIGQTRPIATPGAAFRDFNTYQVMTYTKPSLVFRMLRWYMGDPAFRTGLHLYYQNNVLTHVDEGDFRGAMEKAAGQDLGWFFDEWLHTTNTLDYAIEKANTVQQPNGSWRTTVTVTRAGDIWMPVDLAVGGKTIRLDSKERSYFVDVETTEKPAEAVLDPDKVLIDIVRGNNRRAIQ